MDLNEDQLRHSLTTLRLEHTDLDSAIDRLSHGGDHDELQVKRMKKRKLILKDKIELLEFKLKLAELKTEHGTLDSKIMECQQSGMGNQIEIQRLKKRKLVLRDQITKMESMLLPDSSA